MVDDIKAVEEIYGHVKKVISVQGASGERGLRGRSGLKLPPPDKDHGGLRTVMAIQGASVDPERRLKAIEASRMNREKELAGEQGLFGRSLR